MSQNAVISSIVVGVIITLALVSGCFVRLAIACLSIIIGVALLGAPFLILALVFDWITNKYQGRQHGSETARKRT